MKEYSSVSCGVMAEAATRAPTNLPSHYQFYGVSEDPVQSKGKAGGWKGKELLEMSVRKEGRSHCLIKSNHTLETDSNQMQTQI